MTIAHAAVPSICSDCLAACHELASQGEGALLKRCDHLGRIVLAVGYTAGGLIIRWDIKGPMSQAEAEHLALAFLRAIQQPLQSVPTSLQ